jgi:DNA-binding CsgD family transcriptional regulator
MTAEGYTSREVGTQLGISSRTVEKHRENIKNKLGLRSVVEMADYAYQRGFLPDPRVLHAREPSMA